MDNRTKETLLKAAIKIFAEKGFASASTREIVKAAGVNISAITYYFESKEGLYLAVLDYIVNFMKDGVKENITTIMSLAKDDSLTPHQARNLFLQALTNMIKFACGETISPEMVEILLREQISPSGNSDILYPNFIMPMHEMLTFLFAKATNQDPEDKKTIIETHSVLGQVLIFKTHQGFLNRRLDIKNYKHDIDKITEAVLKHTNAILDSYSYNCGENQ